MPRRLIVFNIRIHGGQFSQGFLGYEGANKINDQVIGKHGILVEPVRINQFPGLFQVLNKIDLNTG